MKTIIAGSRDNVTYEHIKDAVKNCGWIITEVVEGGARGADRLGRKWAIDNTIPYITMNADWDKHGKSAGYRRNTEMAEVAEALIAIRANMSKGTTHMINIAKNKGLRIYVIEIEVKL